MDPSYETVVDPVGMVWTLVPYLFHGAAIAAQAGLAVFLLFTHGLALAVRREPEPSWALRLGMPLRSQNGFARSGLRFVLGMGLLAPLALGAPAAVSALATMGAIALLIVGERGLPVEEATPGRWTRRVAISCGFVALLMMGIEREDNVVLGADLLANASKFRSEELGWQLETDSRAPKVGDLAPDFELQDPEGAVRVRLSDFRGKRPVALVFGSYT